MSPKDTLFSVKRTINCQGRVIDLTRPKIMGILNVTPDSFYDGGRHTTPETIGEYIDKLIAEGADIIDIGGYSSRPGAEDISPDEEKARLSTALKLIRQKSLSCIVSIDTFRPEIAEFAVNEYGVSMINDISAGVPDDKMLKTAGRLKVPYIMMHMQGTPRNMQVNPHYEDVARDLLAFFSGRIARARENGISDILVDPGFGFGKTLAHNFTLLRELGLFEILDCPLVVGVSRKSMAYKSLGLTPADALSGTIVLQTLALLNGASVLRVHDVKEAVQIVKLIDLYRNAGNNGFLL